MGSFSKNIALLAIGLWLGAVALFAAVVAPTLFNTDVAFLSRDMAGAISGAILRRIYLLTYLCIGLAAFFLTVCSFGEAKGARGPRRALLLCLLLLGLNAANDIWIHGHISRLRLQMANMEPGQAHGLKKQFDTWHKTSVWIYSSSLACGTLAALFLLPSVAGGKSRRPAR
jgi:hypothetical protein